MDWGIRDKWDSANRRKTLALSLEYVEKWASETEGCFDPQTMTEVWKAAQSARHVVEISSSPGVDLKYMGGCRKDFQFLLDLVPRLREKPEDDQNRCNSALRTALRRVDDYLTHIGATFQYC